MRIKLITLFLCTASVTTGCSTAVLRKIDKKHDTKGVMACGEVIDGSKSMAMCEEPKENLCDVSKPD